MLQILCVEWPIKLWGTFLMKDLIFRVKRNGLMCCARGREYCSSFPVKYIPKKCSISEKFEPASSRVKSLVEREKHDSLDMNVPREKSFSNSRGRVLDTTEPKNHDYLRIANINYCLNLRMVQSI